MPDMVNLTVACCHTNLPQTEEEEEEDQEDEEEEEEEEDMHFSPNAFGQHMGY